MCVFAVQKYSKSARPTANQMNHREKTKKMSERDKISKIKITMHIFEVKVGR